MHSKVLKLEGQVESMGQIFPQEFTARMQVLGQNAERIYSVIPRKCIRTREVQAKDPVPWYDKATFDTSVKGYIQDPASLIPAIVLDPRPGESVLDMCAAPGSKTTQIWEMTDGDVLLYSVDVNNRRLMRLKKNIELCGCDSVKLIRADARKLKFDFQFDKILLDAPCSGEGIVLKAHKTFKIWSENRVARLTKDQKKMIKRAFSLLKPGGVLVYSTCTFEKEENEDVVQWLLDITNSIAPEKSRKGDSLYSNSAAQINSGSGSLYSASLEKIDIPNLVCDRGIDMPEAIRIYPYQNQTNGFFVAKIKKSS